jgi:hypothetical protein
VALPRRVLTFEATAEESRYVMPPENSNELARRGANTQSLFRIINERVEDLNKSFSGLLEIQDWVCECADDTCVERVALSLGEYEEVRANPTRFVIAPSDAHVFEEIEDVVERTERYWVVEKKGTAGEVAATADPRRVERAPHSD